MNVQAASYLCVRSGVINLVVK